jgi:hypothetical protein
MENYSKIQKILHKIIFESNFISQSIYELEKILFLKKTKNLFRNNHLFISSLPRSGTTFLLNYFYETGQYASLTYNDMPFVMATNFYSIFKKKGEIIDKERLHGDGLRYNIESPESFDEIFFRTISQKNFQEFKNFVNLILLNKKKDKYLSKNNLNYTRINDLISLFPNVKILIPIRDPLDHSNSLYEQNKNFLLNQKKDKYIKQYMNYLGHHEFGIDHKYWNKPIIFKDKQDINYWLEQWYLFYNDVYNKYKNNKNCLFVNYEKLYDTEYIKKILSFIKCDAQNKLIFVSKKKQIKYSFNDNLKKKCLELFKNIS